MPITGENTNTPADPLNHTVKRLPDGRLIVGGDYWFGENIDDLRKAIDRHGAEIESLQFEVDDMKAVIDFLKDEFANGKRC